MVPRARPVVLATMDTMSDDDASDDASSGSARPWRSSGPSAFEVLRRAARWETLAVLALLVALAAAFS